MPPEIGGYPQEDRLPNVQFFYPEDTGHQAQTDSPELMNQIFLEFFRDGKVSWETAQRAGISTRRPPLQNLVAVPETAKT
jgi:2-hydroxy-6-oxonona-2,4-dienedioate hydrolase